MGPKFDKVWEKFVVCPETACWLWTDYVKPNGYAEVKFGKGARIRDYAHRWMYRLEFGEIPDGMELDHRCRVRHCVNPWHLEPVTRAENLRRGREARGVKRKERVKKGRRDDCRKCGEIYSQLPCGKRYCKPCAAKKRKHRYANDPEYRAMRRGTHTRWAEKNREYVRKKMSEYYYKRKAAKEGEGER